MRGIKAMSRFMRIDHDGLYMIDPDDVRRQARVLPKHERAADDGLLRHRVREERAYRRGFHQALAMLLQVAEDHPGADVFAMLSAAKDAACKFRYELRPHQWMGHDMQEAVRKKMKLPAATEKAL
jgi:hypothetical protein